MIKHIHHEELGRGQYGWLEARYHFSFGHYFNPARTGYGALLVINDDLIEGQSGFPPHGHKDMEIITYVRRGAISHKDSENNEGVTMAGNVQVMSAGAGIQHSEWNSTDEVTSLYQIWILPREKNLKPRWDAAVFPQEPVQDKLNLLVSGDKSAPLYINQDAEIYAGNLEEGTEIVHQLQKLGYLLVSKGHITISQGDNLLSLKAGDGCEIAKGAEIKICADDKAEVLLLDVPELEA